MNREGDLHFVNLTGRVLNISRILGQYMTISPIMLFKTMLTGIQHDQWFTDCNFLNQHLYFGYCIVVPWMAFLRQATGI